MDIYLPIANLSVNALVTELPYSIKPKYDPFKDLKPLVDLGGGGLVFVGNASLRQCRPERLRCPLLTGAGHTHDTHGRPRVRALR